MFVFFREVFTSGGVKTFREETNIFEKVVYKIINENIYFFILGLFYFKKEEK